jgi:hypothetical protein
VGAPPSSGSAAAPFAGVLCTVRSFPLLSFSLWIRVRVFEFRDELGLGFALGFSFPLSFLFYPRDLGLGLGSDTIVSFIIGSHRLDLIGRFICLSNTSSKPREDREMGRKREEPSPWLDVGVVAAMVTGCRR